MVIIHRIFENLILKEITIDLELYLPSLPTSIASFVARHHDDSLNSCWLYCCCFAGVFHSLL